MMTAGEARAQARRWVAREAPGIPGVVGAFLHGSINEMPDHVPLPATSDVDVMLVVDGVPPALKLGKFDDQGVLLEVSFLAAAGVASPEAVLRQYAIAPSLRYPSVIWDPSGRLSALQSDVARAFAQQRWVRERCEDARQNVLRHAAALRAPRPYHDQVMAWLFAAGVTTHVLLVAGLHNPTVRKRYLAVRRLLNAYGHADFYPTLLGLMGATHVSRAQANAHVDALDAAFDAAGAVLSTPYRFAADMQPAAKVIAVHGSRDLIRQGDHREALFWITAIYSRCMHVLTVDGTPALLAQHAPGYHRLLADLGMHGSDDLHRGVERITAAVPAVWAVAEEIMARNPEVVAE